MTTSLTNSEIAAIQELAEILLSPLDHDDVRQWQHGVAAAVTHLIGADSTTIRLPARSLGDRPWLSDKLEASVIERYPEELATLLDPESQVQLWQRAGDLGVWHRRVLHHPNYSRYLASAYYNEYLVPIANSAYGAGMTWLPDGDAASHCVVSMHPNRAARSESDFEERELLILRLLFPAFRAGTSVLLRLDAIREALPAQIDELRSAVTVFRGTEELHRNAALRRLLEMEDGDGRSQLEAALEDLAGSGMPTPEKHSTTVRTPQGAYRLEAIRLGEERFDRDPTTLILVHRARPSLPKIDTLLARWDLTSREHEVAALVALGRSNKKIGAELEISSHTVKRHLESIFKKLGIRRRSELMPHLRSAMRKPPEGDGTGGR